MINYGESKIDKIMFGEQMIDKVLYGESLLFSSEPDHFITIKTVEPNQEIELTFRNMFGVIYKKVTSDANCMIYYNDSSYMQYNNPLTDTFIYHYNTSNKVKAIYINFRNVNINVNCDTIRSIFQCNSQLIDFKIIGFDTVNIKTFCGVFKECRNLEIIDLSKFNFLNLKNFYDVFNTCGKLKEIKLPSMPVVKDLSRTFQNCWSLEKIDLSMINFSNVVYYNDMFDGCYNLNYIKCSSSVRDWCWENQDEISLPDAMKEGGDGTWDIVD